MAWINIKRKHHWSKHHDFLADIWKTHRVILGGSTWREEAWRGNHPGEIVGDKAPSRKNHGWRIINEKIWRRNHKK